MIAKPYATRLLTLLVLSLSAFAGSAAETIVKDKPKTTGGFYGQEDNGWFFYKDPPPKAPAPKPAKPKPGSTPEKPPVLSAVWIRDNLDKYRFQAIDNPTKDNVELYLLLQKLAMDKAEQFALASRGYAQQNPGIDETIQNPTSAISRSSLTLAQEQNQNKVLAKIGKKAGIYYFFRSDCVYCHKQNPMIPLMVKNTKIAILPISLDGLPSDDGLLPNWRPDRGQGAYLGVEKTPSMYLVDPAGKVLLLSAGVRAMPDLNTRIIELAKDEKWISAEEYDLAMRGLPRKFLTAGLEGKSLEDDPVKMLAVLRDASTYGKIEGSFTDMESGESSPWKKGSK